MSGNVIIFKAAVLTVVVLACSPAFAASQSTTQEDGQWSPDTNREDRADEERRGALDWLDRYITVQILFDRKDIEALRAKVATMPAGELHDWIQKTKQIRAKLESERWQQTREWLREFLRVQASYSDDEIAKFRAKDAEMSPREVNKLIGRIEHERKSLQWMHAASERSRKATLALGQKYRRRQEARRQAALNAGYRRGDRPFFGTDRVYAYPRYGGSRSYLPPPPLITSREVARWSVYRSIFGGFGP